MIHVIACAYDISQKILHKIYQGIMGFLHSRVDLIRFFIIVRQNQSLSLLGMPYLEITIWWAINGLTLYMKIRKDGVQFLVITFFLPE